ncbi:hypothetical protein [Reichenbachiella sp. MALMAid0571]|uniref:hypothetical protein n=1 Tax=Reichenbachiella sp. MALMAid0571 TaxID=3143939 RepID=UPI0032DF69B5
MSQIKCNSIRLLSFCISVYFLTACQESKKLSTQTAQEIKRPNILFAISDDQSWLHTGATGKDSLSSILMAHLKTSGDPRASGQDPWQDYVYHQYDGFGAVYNKILPKSVRNRARFRPSHQPKWVIE